MKLFAPVILKPRRTVFGEMPSPKYDDVVDDGRMTGGAAVGDLRIGRRQHDVADRLERDAVVPRVEPDQRLPLRLGPVGPGMDEHRLVDGIARSSLERVLDAVARTDVMAGSRPGRLHARAECPPGPRRPGAALPSRPAAGAGKSAEPVRVR